MRFRYHSFAILGDWLHIMLHKEGLHMPTKGNGEKKFAPGFLLVVDGILASRQKNATTPEEALANLLRSKYGYLVTPGTKVRVLRVVEEGDNDAITELYGEQVELEPLVSTERV